MTSLSRFVRLYAFAVLVLIQSLAYAAPGAATPAVTPSTVPQPAAAAQPAAGTTATPRPPRVGMVTMQPGQEFWSRFGHDALVVLDQDSGAAISYNFGFFDPTEPDFVQRFIDNNMRYRLVALPFDQDMAQYGYEGRGVSIQWLNLSPAQARQIAEALRINALPENAFYRYQYFDDNCATRVRDAIDTVLGGALRRQIEGRSHGNTLRSEALRLSKPDLWMWATLDILMGPDTDKPVPVWAESYVPARLADALREAKNDQGQPLVQAERELLPHRIAPAPEATPLPWWPWALVGLVFGVALAWIGDRSPRVLAFAALPLWGLLGLIGAILIYGWFGTGHNYLWGNRNLLLFNPLCLLLWFGGWRALRGRETGPVFVWLTALAALSAVAALFLYWLPLYPQRNAHWIALWLPIHLGLWFGFRKAAKLRLA
ncbi:lipoprotein N-acyltransferase Lnb domain-containing protein [Lysobacter gummosus]|uniref:lipoprotein N-acyltransferase Lnb domain-containing protein n=1 Tax=Lysobacter gummosus TaxID=262324 RepID=UPI003636DA38